MYATEKRTEDLAPKYAKAAIKSSLFDDLEL